MPNTILIIDDNAEYASSLQIGLEAEGIRQARILAAGGEAEAIQLVNDAANKFFVGNAQLLKRLETVQISLQNNTKIVVPANTELVNVIGELAGGILPLKKEK